jgi:raffinose/stachyose/melibiose transport system permease protein
VAYLYILPAAPVYGLFVLIPFLHSVYLLPSSRAMASTRMDFVGLANYGDIITNPILRSSFLHAFQLIAFYAIIPRAPWTLPRQRAPPQPGPGHGLLPHRVSCPTLIARRRPSPSSGAGSWPRGPLNSFLRETIGLGPSPALARRLHLGLAERGTGGHLGDVRLVLALLLAGVQKIPTDLYEAARLDGAGAWMGSAPSPCRAALRDRGRPRAHRDRRPAELRHHLRR